MAQVYRPPYTEIDPKTGKRVKGKSRTYHVRYYTPDGQRHRVKGYRDKKATEALAAELERRGIRVDAGLVDPADVHAKRPLAEHAEDFRRYLAAKENTQEYVAKLLFRLTAVLDGCRFVKIGDVQASAVVEFLGALRLEGKSIKTANDYLSAVKGLTRWLWKDKRSALDALASLSKLSHGEANLRHARREFSPEELRRLLDAACQSPRFLRKLSGRDRYFLYLTACATGFRASELASLTPEAFNLDSDTPTATVQAACTKNRREAVQPLPLDVARNLRDYLRDKPAGKPVWPGKWKSRAFLMVQKDLHTARQQWLSEAQNASERARRQESDYLAYCDSQGRYADFHALRHSYITMVGKAGVSPREHQDLARHSTYSLTSRYTHSRFYDLAAAVQSLPIPTTTTTTAPQAGVLAATGTDGSFAGKEGAKNLSPNLVLRQDVLGDFGRQTETGRATTDTGVSPKKNPEKPCISAIFRGLRQDGVEMEPRGFQALAP